MWVKNFKDGSKEYGSDMAIDIGKASWSRGRLDSISSVDLIYNKATYSLIVSDTAWCQFDRFHVLIDGANVSKPVRIYRVVQAEIKPQHVGKSLCVSYGHKQIIYKLDDLPFDPSSLVLIKEDDVSKWITVRLPYTGGSDVGIASRGSIHDYKLLLR